MNDLNKVMNEITQLTANIESNYPELYTFLDENPITNPSETDPKVDLAAYQDYLESLKTLLKHHIEEHRIKRENEGV